MIRHPAFRPRRMRAREGLRRLIRETHLSADRLVMPLFVRPGAKVRAPIASMPGQFQYSVDELAKECEDLAKTGVPAVLLFGLPAGPKDERGSGAFARDGIIPQAVRAVKARVPDLVVMTDVCLCGYTSHGHCGVLRTAGKRPAARVKGKAKSKPPSRYPAYREGEFWIDNDATLELLGRVAAAHAQAGADVVAPSDMMDGDVAAIRRALDDADHVGTAIMGYSAKYASSFYGPFREAADSAPAFGDRRSYQMDIANAEEALREARLDAAQGADIIMVKPALAYLDVISRIKQAIPHPLAAFNVSGEYAMVRAAAARGWIAERPAWWEMLVAMRRAGADLLITYWAKEAARALRQT
jgi:porphobilinogen synthase